MEKEAELEEIAELEPLPEPEEAKKTRRLPPLLRLCRRATVFLSLTLIATIIFFLTGNQQVFLDSNLKLILQIITFNAIALSFFSGISSLECIFYLVKNKSLRMLLHFIVYILVLTAAITISVFSLTINLLSEGISF